MNSRDLQVICLLFPVSLLMTGMVWGFNFLQPVRITLPNEVYQDTTLIYLTISIWFFFIYLFILARQFVLKPPPIFLLILLITANVFWMFLAGSIAYISVAVFGLTFFFDILDISAKGNDFLTVISVCLGCFIILVCLEVYLIIKLTRTLLMRKHVTA